MTDIVRLFCLPIAEAVSQVLKQEGESVQEIRIRAGKPLAVSIAGKSWFVSPKGERLQTPDQALCVGWEMVLKCLELISGSSLYAFENEIKNGYITVEGGHRIGMTGKAQVRNGQIQGIHPITGFNVRIAHEVKGCAEKLLPYVVQKGRLMHTLLLSPPGGGKTTMLRDLIRLASDELGLNVAVADERSEIGGSFRGVPQCDIGSRTDVLDGAPKSEGMLMMLRSMNPQVIAVDELGALQELEAIETIMNAGVRLICTAHSANLEELRKKPGFADLIRRGSFERVVVLSGRRGPGTIEGIYQAAEGSGYAVV